MKKDKIKVIIMILFLTILCVAFANKSISESNDTFYLIKNGEVLYKYGFSLIDRFSWISNLPYTYPHWLYSIIIYLVYHFFGFNGVYIGNIIVYIFLVLSIFYINYKTNHDYFLSFIFSLISLFALKIFIVPRAHVISAILFLWEVYYLHSLINTGKKKYIFILAIISLLIANIHGTSWLMFFIFFLPFIGSHIIYLLTKKKKINCILNDKVFIKKVNNFKLLLIAFVICLLMGFLTPSRICYTYVFKVMLGDSESFIQEHFPLVLINYPLIIITLFSLYFSKTKISLSELFMISGLFCMSFLSRRHIIFIYTIVFVYFAKILKENITLNKDKTFSIIENKLFNSKFSICILLIPIIVCYFRLPLELKKPYIDEKQYPVYAASYIKENLDYKNIKMYNDYNIGSFLLFNDLKVFIDSRCDLYLKEFNGKNLDVFDDDVDINFEYNYEENFTKYNITHVLLNKESNLNKIISKDNKYILLYEDDNFLIYERII